MRFTKSLLGILFATGLLSATSSSAHDGWLEITGSEAGSRGGVEIALLIGHGNERRQVDLTPLPIWVRKAVVVARDHHSGAIETRDIVPDIGFDIEPSVPGTLVVGMTTFAFTNEMPPDAFNEYLRQEGLTDAIKDREKRGVLHEIGREIYHRTAKLILSGDDAGKNDFVTKPLGLNLEIVPQCDPTVGACGQSLPIQLLFNGHPLSGAQVVLNDLGSDEWPTAVLQTNSKGIARFDLPHDGQWMISTIWSWPVEQDERGDYESIFSSLAFAKREGATDDMARTAHDENLAQDEQ